MDVRTVLAKMGYYLILVIMMRLKRTKKMWKWKAMRLSILQIKVQLKIIIVQIINHALKIKRIIKLKMNHKSRHH